MSVSLVVRGGTGLVLGVLLVMGCFPSPPGPETSRSVSIVVATDLHELAPNLHDNGSAYQKFAASGAGRDILHTEELLDAFERDLSLDRPAWLILTGDLTNNGERESHRALATRLARIEAAGTSVLVIPGNHDVSNPWARAFREDRQVVVDSVSPQEFASLYRDFGYAEAVSRDGSSLSYRAELNTGLWFLMLDTNRYQENPSQGRPVTGGRLSPSTLNWIRDQLAAARLAQARVVVAQHHNLFDHSEVIADGFTVENASQIAELYAEAGVRLVLSGHIHIQDAVSQEIGDGVVYDIATNALSVNPHQFGRLFLDPLAGSVRYRTQVVDVEGWARASGRLDSVLTGYRAWSTQSFGNTGRQMALKRLDLPPDEAQAAADTMALLNLRYFAGQEALNSDLAGTPGLKALLGSEQGFLAGYAQSILADDTTDDNSLDFPF